ncbi:MAG: AMP-binding protein, partial [Acidimicrobiales bacterium]
LPRLEREAIVELADPAVVIGAEVAGRECLPTGFRPSHQIDCTPLADAVAGAWKAPTSGGSTGLPKLIVSGDPSTYDHGQAGLASLIGAGYDTTMVIPGPLYHNGPFIWTFLSLLAGSHVVLLPRFDAEATLAAIDTHRAKAIYLVPTMMQRIWKLPTEDRLAYDVTSLEVAFHLAEPCPAWLKREWIDWLGPEVIWELYGGTEAQAFTVLNGTEWLEHPGSVGRTITGEMVIRDPDGRDLPPGGVGDVWMRWAGRDSPTYHYIGAEPDESDGWECLGDVGWMDDDGYLYLADRRKDMILVGGANVYPAEVEAALNAHPGIRSAAVIGLPDEERGNTVHAIIEADELDTGELKSFLGERLVSYKIPRSFEMVHEALRDDAGKVRRSALREARLQG